MHQPYQQLQHSQSPPPGTPRNVRVVARIRPPTELELMKAGGDFICLSVPSPQTVEITLCKYEQQSIDPMIDRSINRRV